MIEQLTSFVQSLDGISALAIVGTALVLIALERIFPYDKGQKLFRQGFWTDLIGYGLIQSWLLAHAIAFVVTHIDAWTGLGELKLLRELPLWAQIAILFVVHDFYIYWFHRLQHASDVLWRTHEAHHSVSNIDWLAGTRSHSLEILINQTVEFLPLVLLASPEAIPIKAAIDAMWGMYIHSNVGVRAGVLQYVINGPQMHRWHHALDIAPPGVNFGTKLAIWDWIFGTAYFPKDKKPSGYGNGDASYPTHGALAWLRQHVYAFRSFRARAATQDVAA